MKKYLYLITIGLLLIACGGSGGDDTPPPPEPPTENKAPSSPTQIYPANNDLCIDNSVTFSWNAATDPENDVLSYVVEVSENNSFSPLTETKTVSTTSTTISLEKGVAFYWRILAKDSNNSSNYSAANSFYTEGNGVTNYVPFSPELVTPTNNETVQSTTVDLKWTARDVDNDALTYDVYLDTTNPPTTKKEDNSANTTVTITVESSKNYYWYVVAKDGNGGKTIGQVWQFKTD